MRAAEFDSVCAAIVELVVRIVREQHSGPPLAVRTAMLNAVHRWVDNEPPIGDMSPAGAAVGHGISARSRLRLFSFARREVQLTGACQAPRQAHADLASTRDPVTQVASRCGYADMSHLCPVVREAMNLTPRSTANFPFGARQRRCSRPEAIGSLEYGFTGVWRSGTADGRASSIRDATTAATLSSSMRIGAFAGEATAMSLQEGNPWGRQMWTSHLGRCHQCVKGACHMSDVETHEVPAGSAGTQAFDQIPDTVRAAGRRWPERTFAEYPYLDRTLSFGDLDRQSERLAHWLVGQGVRAGDRVAVMLENVPEWPIAWAAILKAGAVTVPVNVRYRNADIAHVLRDSGSVVILTGQRSAATVADVRNAEKLAVRIVVLQEVLSTLSELSGLGLPTLVADDVANLQYTSGTTGFPKACVLTHAYWIKLASEVAASASVTDDDVVFVSQAWSYVDPQWLTSMCLLTGARMTVEPKFSASGFWPAVRAAGATITYVLGAMPLLLFKQPESEDDPHNRMRLVLCSGIPVDLHARLEARWGAPWREMYGSTESGVDLIARPEDAETVGTGALGEPPRGKRVLVVDSDGQEVPVGASGEIVVEGSPLMNGYWNLPGPTAAVLEGGRYRTGDLGVRNARGQIRHVGRLKEMIRRGGENISAAEVESVLSRHEAVLAVAVAGIPDEIYEEIPKAFVILRDGTAPSEEVAQSIFRHGEEQLAPFKVPEFLDFCDAFPMTPSERVQKKKLLAEKDDHREGSYQRVSSVKREGVN